MRRWVALVLFFSACLPGWAVRTAYTVQVRPEAKRVHVSLLVAEDPDADVTVAIPVWVPGYYQRLNQYRGISHVRASEDGKDLSVERPTPSTWRVHHTPNAPLQVDYDVDRSEYAFGLAPEVTLGEIGVYTDKENAFIHPGIACMYVDGHTDAPASLSLDLPKGWDVATTLEKGTDGTYRAPDYETLDDSPMEMGRFSRISFTAAGHPFEIITTGDRHVSDDALRGICKPLVEQAVALFGGYVPFPRYQFHFHFTTRRPITGLGLEHAASTIIVFTSKETDESVKERAAAYVSHELTHAWDVKALRPEGLGPFDYQHEVKTPSLWVVEGIDDYYATRLLEGSGLWPHDWALGRMDDRINEYRNSPGRFRTSLVQSSMDVWSGSENSNGAGGTDYYTKGALAAWLLDIRIRAATKGAKGLDDAMRWMMDRYARTDTPYPPDTLLTAIREATGVVVDREYASYVHGTDDLPFEALVPLAGLTLKPVPEPDPDLGVELADGGRIAKVTPGRAGEAAGLHAGDIVLKVDGVPVEKIHGDLLGEKERKIGDTVPVVIRRDGEERTVSVTVKSRPYFTLAAKPDATPEQKAVREAMTPARAGSQ